MAIKLPEWKLYSLEMDGAGEKIGGHFKSQGYDLIRVNPGGVIPEIEYFIPKVKKHADTGLTAKAISDCINTDSRVLALYGHGGYHFFTYGLLRRAGGLVDDMGYIHIDHHHDSWFVDYKTLSCGAFVKQIYFDTRVCDSKGGLLYLGNDGGASKGIWLQNALFGEELTEGINLEKRLELMKVPDVYVTIDLDVMHKEEVRTAFERGNLRLNELNSILKKIKQQKRIISADICGFAETDLPYADPEYLVGKGIPSFEQSMKVYKTLADTIMEA